MPIKITIRKTYVEKRIIHDEDENEQTFGASMLRDPNGGKRKCDRTF